DTQGFLRSRLGSRPGPVVTADGEQVGTHDGAYAFTVGQRRGLSLGYPAPDGRPRYVLEVHPVRNTVVVGSAEELEVHAFVGEEAGWLDRAAEAMARQGGVAGQVQVRAHGSPVPAQARVDGDTVELRLGTPLRGVAPGQSAVLYDGTRVLAHATVGATRR